jgi:hypothetical protein
MRDAPRWARLSIEARKALEDVAHAAWADTILGWFRRPVVRKVDGSTRRVRGSHEWCFFNRLVRTCTPSAAAG